MAPIGAVKNPVSLFAGCVLSVLLLIGPVHSQESRNVRFILDWTFQAPEAQFTIPAYDGAYAKYHLNVSVDRGFGSGDTVAKVASGAYDMGLADLYSMVRFNGENPAHRLIAVMLVNDKSAVGIESKASSNIKTPQDLVGKTMASPVGDAGRELFPLFARVNKIDANSIKWINVSPQMRETMLLQGQADAIPGLLTTVMMNMRAMNVPASDIRAMMFGDYGVPLYGEAVIVTPAYAEAHPDVVRDVIRAGVHGLQVMIKDPDTTVASLKARDPLISEDIEKARLKMALDYMFVTPNVLKNGVSHVDWARLNETLAEAGAAFGIKNVPQARDVYTDRYLPPQSEMMVSE